MSRGKRFSFEAFLFAALIIPLLGWLFWTAWRLRLEYFDDYTVLTNAHAIAWFRPGEYYWKRFILLPIFLAPLFSLEKVFFVEPFAFVACHLVSVGLYALFIWLFYRLVRLYGSHEQAYMAAGFLAANRLIIHFAPFVKEDISATLLMTAGFYFYIRGQKKKQWRYLFLTSFCWAGAMADRYNFILPILAVAGCLEARAVVRLLRDKAPAKTILNEVFRRTFFSAVLPAALFFLVPALLYSHLGYVSFCRGPAKLIHEIGLIRRLNLKPEPPAQNIFFIGLSLTWPILAASLAGMALAWRRKRPEAFLFMVWAGLFFLYQTLMIYNKEARYLFPVYPPLYFFATFALTECRKCLTAISSARVRRAALVLGAGLFFLWPIRNGVAECARFLNPVYTFDYARKLSLAARDLARPAGEIYWVGKMYSLHDRDFIFHPEDEVTYIYHVYNHTVGFYADRLIHGFGNPNYFASRDPKTGQLWVFALELGTKLHDGDVLIMNLEEKAYETKTLPIQLKPLVMARVRLLELKTVSSDSQGQTVFSSPVLGNLQVRLEVAVGGSRELVVSGVPNGVYEIYFDQKRGERLWQSLAIAQENGFKKPLQTKQIPVNPAGIVLLTYDKTVFFPHPN